VLAVVVALLCGCGSAARGPATNIERTFDVHWRDHANAYPVRYRVDGITFHDGRWSVRATVVNATAGPLYEATWAPPGSNGVTWNGPALVYSGRDVLGNRRLIFVPADRETPDIAFPLRRGATWRGTIEGKIPATPPLPHDDEIWFRYPVFGVGQVWDGVNSALAVQWISERAVLL
jgi:hypothetical protein